MNLFKDFFFNLHLLYISKQFKEHNYYDLKLKLLF
jgi:hypothetical protein